MKKTEWVQLAKRWETYAFLVVTVLALQARLNLWPFESGDYTDEIRRWYECIRVNGFHAFKDDFAPPYTPLYLYLFYIGNLLLSHIPQLLIIKMISIAGDFVCALFTYKLVRLRYATGIAPLFAFTAVLLAPTVVWNGALWAQCDSLYTGGLLACVYFLALDRSFLAFIAYGLAFSLKLQAIFLAPFLIILLWKRQVSWRYFVLIPALYVATILPACLAGRPFLDLLTIYLRQPGFYAHLSMNAPNVYQWFPVRWWGLLFPAGLVWSATLVFLFCLFVCRSRLRVTSNVVIQLSTALLLIVPFFLPRMHERYFYPADILSVVFAFYFPRFFLVPVFVQSASLFSYFPFLFGYEIVPLSVSALVLFLAIIILFTNLIQTFRRELPAGVQPALTG